jgi:Domain of unknown function (DUF4908)
MELSMVSATRAFSGGTVIATALVGVALAGLANPAGATPAWVKKALSFGRSGEGQTAAPPTARYQSDEGGTFILDRSGRWPLLKFDDSPEVWALTSSRGPRGDIIYFNDLGEPFLRATKLGGMTVFTASSPEGSAVSLVGPCNPPRLMPLGLVKLYQRLYFYSVRSSRAAQHLVAFDAPDADIKSDGLIADAAGLAVEATVALSARGGGKALLARVTKVAFMPGARVGVSVRGGVVSITIVPGEGFAGRPSSERILRGLEAR